MQNGRRGERRQHGASTGFGQGQRRPADFLDRPRRHAGAERRRHHLRTKANAECRFVRGKARGECFDLVGDERIDVRFIDADRPAEHDDEIGFDDGGGIERIDPSLKPADGVTACDE